MGNGEVNLGVFGGIIYARLKRAMRLEKLRLEFDLALHIDLANRRSVPANFIDKLLLRSRRGEVHTGLRTKARRKKVQITLNDNFLN